ncbi:PARP-domain-containing protein [Periconia macrospinosa]|uniref:Poly [ADP-ribose] polymerase n=1 Tax=Periconia macrospinosa TaxID=97972 RepID=A0A2V1DGV1_9PLEO|nr:PARP-domain-containing protein [Periconia macrospinosa]
MPPKKKSASPLTGNTLSISGTFPGQTQTAVQNTIASLGGGFAKSVTADTNILVSTAADVAKNSKKVQDAISNGIPIVSIEWLNDTVTNNKAEDTDSYLLVGATATSQPAANGNGTAKGKKRAASSAGASASTVPPKAAKLDPAASAPKLEPKVGEGSVAKSRDVNIPVDEYCPLQSSRVYVGEDGVIYDALLNQTNASANNNKFYRIQLLRNPSDNSFKTWTRWGRVGDRGQSALLGGGDLDDAIVQYNKKFKDKSGLSWDDRGAAPKKGKYAYVERSYESDSDAEDDEAMPDAPDGQKRSASPAKSTLPAPVQDLMRLIFNTDYMNQAMTALNYDAEKMPLGKLSKATINRGFQALKDLAALLNVTQTASTRSDIEHLSNTYYSVIPHNFGRSRPPIIQDANTLKRELDLLDSLGDMKEAAALMKKELSSSDNISLLDRQFKGLGLEEMTVLDRNDNEFQELASYLSETKGSTHNVQYQVIDIFRIERNGELDRFKKSEFAKIKSDRRLLWHGSRATNFGGILSQGLRIAPPEAPVSGYMFGKGIYLADMSSKSANYCCAYNSGGHALLLLCEAELGNPLYELTGASYNAGDDAYKNGSYSTWGKGMTGPQVWKDAGSVHPSLAGIKMPDTKHRPTSTNVPGAYLQYNEYIAYDIAQVRLRYLFRVKM